MIDREKVIKSIEDCVFHNHDCVDCNYDGCVFKHGDCRRDLLADSLTILKEQEAEIRQLRLALDIAKGTCKGIKSGGGQFADMQTMQSAT